MVINHNISALNTYNQLSKNEKSMSSSLQKLSSGLRINSAADDAAGLAISQKMTAQVNGLDQASSNAQNGISLVQTAEGALNETQSILQRMRELAVQSATDTNTSSDRNKIQSEVDQLSSEITRISNTTEFNTKNLLAGGLDATLQIGANQDQNITFSVNAMDAKSLGVSRDIQEATGFAAGTTTLSSSAVGQLGSGLTAGTYTIAVTHSAASASVTGRTTTGAASVAATTYSGARGQNNVMFKVTAVNANEVTSAQYSTDGGSTWNAASVADNGSGDGEITYQGAKIDIATAAGNAVGQTVTATFGAKSDSIQLVNPSAANVGAAVTVYSDQSTATIGDAASSQTLVLNSSSLGNLTTGNATVNIALQQSTAATIGTDGSVTTNAISMGGIDVSTQAAANTAITTIDNAINTVSAQRSSLGAIQNRLDHTINNLSTESQNLTSASSAITDVDMAKEMMNYTKDNILNQAAQAMLAQANQLPQGVLQLLK